MMAEPKGSRSRAIVAHSIAAVVALVGLALAGCGLVEENELPPATVTPGATPNLLKNGGFEDGDASWRWLQDRDNWRQFTVTDAAAHSGERGVQLRIEGERGEAGSQISGIVQEISADQFPEFLSGFYRVGEWTYGASFQYLQFVVIVRGGDFGDDRTVHEVRFPIGGIDREPFRPSNAWFIFLSRGQPKIGKWTYFGYPLRRAFEVRWGRAPSRWESIEIFFETRYDGKREQQPESSAAVYLDDLYIGPQLNNPNRPD